MCRATRSSCPRSSRLTKHTALGTRMCASVLPIGRTHLIFTPNPLLRAKVIYANIGTQITCLLPRKETLQRHVERDKIMKFKMYRTHVAVTSPLLCVDAFTGTCHCYMFSLHFLVRSPNEYSCIMSLCHSPLLCPSLGQHF